LSVTSFFGKKIAEIFIASTVFKLQQPKWSKRLAWELRPKVVGSIPTMPAIFQPRIAKNQQGTLSQGISNLCIDIAMEGL